MKCYCGTIITVNANDDVVRYLVEDKGKIIYVGNELPKQYQNAEIIDLKEKALIPAFVDTHQDFASFSTFHSGLNVMGATSDRETAEMIKAFAKSKKAKTLIVFGASPYSVEEKRLISRSELDAVCAQQEVMVVKYDGHACVVNSKLLGKMKDKVQHLRGYHEESGEMNQEAFFAFSNYITNSLSLVDLIRNMQESLDFQAKRGIGCIHTVSGVGFKRDLDITLEKLFAQSLQNGFQIRVFPQSLDTKAAHSRKLPRIGGCFACALDGCFGSHDAAMNEAYTDEEGGNGVLYYSDKKIIAFCKKANREGLQIELHAIGDQAFDQACRALKAALDDYPRKDHRHGIIHACLPTETGMTICKEYQIQLLVQSAFIDWKQEPDSYLESIMGKKRVKRLNPLRTFMENGIVLAAGSDAPCTDPNPIDWMAKAVNHKEEAITIHQALRMCTYNGYYACFDETERGSLECGKIADMTVLSHNPYAMKKEELHHLQVEGLILNGEPYKSCKMNVVKTVLSGLLKKGKV